MKNSKKTRTTRPTTQGGTTTNGFGDQSYWNRPAQSRTRTKLATKYPSGLLKSKVKEESKGQANKTSSRSPSPTGTATKSRSLSPLHRPSYTAIHSRLPSPSHLSSTITHTISFIVNTYGPLSNKLSIQEQRRRGRLQRRKIYSKNNEMQTASIFK